MSLCDRCFAPGACCKGFNLSKGDDLVTHWDDEGEAGVRVWLAAKGHPFEPMAPFQGPWTDKESGRTYSAWRYSCPKLGPGGRCTIYEDRPQLCRDFEPASTELCVHYRGAESGESAN